MSTPSAEIVGVRREGRRDEVQVGGSRKDQAGGADGRRARAAGRARARARGTVEAKAREPLSRERIITAALELVDAEGLEGLTMRALGRRLGVEAMAIYHYFPNKSALLEAMATAAEDVEQVFGGFFAGMDFTGMDAGQRIVAIGLRYIEFAQTHPAHFELLFHVLPLTYPTWEAFVTGTSTFRIPQSLVQAGIDEGAFVERPGFGVDEMAYSLWAFVHGLAVLRKTRLRDVDADFDALHRAALAAFVHAFQNGARQERPG